jgi:hypothetical protein
VGLSFFIERFHVFAVVLAGVAVHVIDCLEGGQQYLLNPVGKHTKTIDLASVEFGELENDPFEGLVDEVVLGLLGEVELGNGLEEGTIEGERVLEVTDEVLDEVLRVLDLLAVEGLQRTVDADPLTLADPPRLHILLQLLQVQLLPLREGHVEQLLLHRRGSHHHSRLRCPQLLSHLRFHDMIAGRLMHVAPEGKLRKGAYGKEG